MSVEPGVAAGVLVHAYLMYGFPSQTDQETVDSLERVRQRVDLGLKPGLLGRRGQPADKLKPITDEQRVGSLLSKIKIAPVRMTQVITITVEDPDPTLAARIAADTP